MQRPGNSVVVDPVTRKVTSIDGLPVTEHTDELQAFADAALAEAGVVAPASGLASRPARDVLNEQT